MADTPAVPNKITHALTVKIGPLPAWAYGIALGVGINVLRWYRSKHAVTATSSTPATGAVSDGAASVAGANSGTTPTQSAVGGYSIPSAYANYGGTTDYSGGIASPSSIASPGNRWVDNRDWSNDAQAQLTGRLGYDPLAVQQALAAILNGDPTTPQQQAIYDTALRQLGYPPPNGIPPIVTATTTQGSPSSAVPPATPDITSTAVVTATAPAGRVEPVQAQRPGGQPGANTENRPTLTVGSTGQAVKAVAQWLNVLEQRGGANWLQAEGTGKYDTQMQTAVREFQAWTTHNTFTGEPGTVDAATWTLIDQAATTNNLPVPPLS